MPLASGCSGVRKDASGSVDGKGTLVMGVMMGGMGSPDSANPEVSIPEREYDIYLASNWQSQWGKHSGLTGLVILGTITKPYLPSDW